MILDTTANTAGLFSLNVTWCSSAHEKYILALLKHDLHSIEKSCKEIIRNMLYFIVEIHAIRNCCEDIRYVECFINTIFSVGDLLLDGDDIKILSATVDVESLIDQFTLYIHFCSYIRHIPREPCICHSKEARELGSGQEHGVALGILVKIENLLRAEAIALTARTYHNLGRFLKGPVNKCINRAVGSDILDCMDTKSSIHIDKIPCTLVLANIAAKFGVEIC